jgi:hypothetical protein
MLATDASTPANAALTRGSVELATSAGSDSVSPSST